MSVALHPVVPVSDTATLRSHLEQYRDFVTKMNDKAASNSLYYQGDLDLVLREGREFRSVPWKTWRGKGYRRMKERQCFKNAHLLAHEHELTYCEGYATRMMLPILHAWCVDAEGRVVDPTWREDAEAPPVETWEYLGVPFELDFVDEVTYLKGCYGVFDDFDIYNYPLPDGAKKEVLG